ncbi:MAG: hypothetical protein Q8O95_01205 [bacterium]|nr:hypothetical protein [bacterium]
MKMMKFNLVYNRDGKTEKFGTMTFNGKFIFELEKNVSFERWEQVGIIPVDRKTLKFESNDLYFYLNSRLPLHLRKASKDQKLAYIEKSGLKVPSDNFQLIPA